MDEQQQGDDNKQSDKPATRDQGHQRRVCIGMIGNVKRGGAPPTTVVSSTTTTSTPPCGACKFLRRKCISNCVFAPYFGTDQGAARFAAVHKVFGASNVSKLLLHIPVCQRQDAVVTITYEAQARLSDPVYGCVSTILALQQQVASLQAELAMVQTQLINSRLVVANALQSSQQQQQIALLQPAYSNNSSASNNLVNLNNNYPSNYDFTVETAPTSRSFKPLQLSVPPPPPPQDEEDDEEESRIHINPVLFANHILNNKK